MEELRRFRRRFGHTSVPKQWPENPGLGYWVANVRRRSDRLDPGQLRSLDALGFAWWPRDDLWEQRFSELAEFRQRHGHANVPVRWSENAELGRWVDHQRQRKRAGLLSNRRIRKLRELGFDWGPRGRMPRHDWDEMLAELADFKRRHGHTRVPQEYEANRALGRWVSGQRQAYARGLLEDSRQRRLERLGFDWMPRRTFWSERVGELRAYRRAYGDCRVPQGWAENKRLATWVNNQRRKYHAKALSGDQMEELEALGFEWTLGPRLMPKKVAKSERRTKAARSERKTKARPARRTKAASSSASESSSGARQRARSAPRSR